MNAIYVCLMTYINMCYSRPTQLFSNYACPNKVHVQYTFVQLSVVANIIQIYSGITWGRVLNGELYT